MAASVRANLFSEWSPQLPAPTSGIAAHAGVCGWRGCLWCCLTVVCSVFSSCSTEVAALLLAVGCAAVCTVASVKLVLLATSGVGPLCAVGVSRVSAFVIFSSPLSSSSLLLLFAVGPLFESFCFGSCVAEFTRFFPCRFFVIASSSKDNTIALDISASSLLLCAVVGGGFCLSVSRVLAVASRSRFCGDGVALLCSAVDIARVVRYSAAFLLCASASCVSLLCHLWALSRLDISVPRVAHTHEAA
jgi:hypothetical protein